MENEERKNKYIENMAYEAEYVGVRKRYIVLDERVLLAKDLSDSEKLVFARIAGFEEYFESAESCGEVLGKSKRVVEDAKRKLEKLGYIECVRNTGRGKVYKTYEKTYIRPTKKCRSDLRKNVGIEERENKEYINTINSIKAETPEENKIVKKEMVELVDNNGEVYERSKRSLEIDECMKLWSEIIGGEIVGKEQIGKDRKAVNSMLSRKDWNVNSVRQLLMVVKRAYGDRYAGRKVKAVNFCEVMYNTNEIVAYARAKMAEKVNNDNYEEI